MDMEQPGLEESVNVLGGSLEKCSDEPVTGFYRDGCCNTGREDLGSHTVCIEVTTQFLEYSRFRGNDLSTPLPESGFPGLNDGDRWCLCAMRWLEAYRFGMAPRVFLKSTHQRSLQIIPLELLQECAADLEEA